MKRNTKEIQETTDPNALQEQETNALQEQEIQYIKKGGGSLRMARKGPKGRKGYKIIPSGSKFWAYPHEIPEGFKDIVVPLNAVPEKEELPLDVEKTEYTKVHKGGGKYNVVDSNGKVINEDLLTKDEAVDLIKSLQ